MPDAQARDIVAELRQIQHAADEQGARHNFKPKNVWGRAADLIDSLRSDIDVYRARLEVDHHFEGNSHDLVRVDVPYVSAAEESCDGIEARDATIRMQKDEIDRLTKELEEAREALQAARKLVVNALRAACELPDFDPADHVVVKKIDAALSKKDEARSSAGAACFDCGRAYDDPGFQDLVLDDDVWACISPTGNEGGLLCPSCICKRLHVAGITTRGTFRSGPLAEKDEANGNG